MAVRQRGTGWQADVQYKGARARESFLTEAEARRWETAARAALKLGKRVPVVEKGPSGPVGRTLQECLEAAEKLHWRSLRSNNSFKNARKFVDWVGPLADPMEVLTSEKIEEFVSSHLMDERKVTNGTVNRYLSALGTLIKFAKVPKPDISHLWRKEGKGRVRFYTDEEEALILQTWLLWSRLKERDFFMFLIDTGARPFSEGTATQWRDIGQRKVTWWDTKNNKPRTVPLTTRAWEAVEKYRGNKLVGPFADINTFNLDRLYGRTRVHLPQLHDTVLYTARHTCCSRLVQRGADLMRVKEWMGHKNINTTMGYAHLAPQHLMDVAHLLEPGKPTLREVG